MCPWLILWLNAWCPQVYAKVICHGMQCVAKQCKENLSPWDRHLQGNLKINHVYIVYDPCIMLCICVLKWRTFMNLTEEAMNELMYDSNLGVQRFEISYKLMLITCVGVSLQGRNTLTCHWQCHLRESDSVGLPIMWQFVNYMDSRAAFTVFFKMVPHAYESTSLIFIAFHVWICTWNVWFGWGMYLTPCLFVLFVFGLNVTLAGEFL